MRPDHQAEHYTVVIPAHNEEATIGSTLRSLTEGRRSGLDPRIVVICNGCTDRTVETARASGADIEVVEIATASKTAAINCGLSMTRDYPLLVVDADVRASPALLDALANALREPGVMAASPVALMDSQKSSPLVRAYYRTWASHDYLGEGVGGSGVYGLSAEGASAIGTFPPVLSDDTFVRWFFPLAQQRRIGNRESGLASRVVAPRTLRDLLACEVRWQAGNRQLRSTLRLPHSDGPVQSSRRSGTLPDRLAYFAIKLAGRALLALADIRGQSGKWHRDVTNRVSG